MSKCIGFLKVNVIVKFKRNQIGTKTDLGGQMKD